MRVNASVYIYDQSNTYLLISQRSRFLNHCSHPMQSLIVRELSDILKVTDDDSVVVEDVEPSWEVRENRLCCMLIVRTLRCYNRHICLHIDGHITIFYVDNAQRVEPKTCEEWMRSVDGYLRRLQTTSQQWVARAATCLSLHRTLSRPTYAYVDLSTSQPLYDTLHDLVHSSTRHWTVHVPHRPRQHLSISIPSSMNALSLENPTSTRALSDISCNVSVPSLSDNALAVPHRADAAGAQFVECDLCGRHTVRDGVLECDVCDDLVCRETCSRSKTFVHRYPYWKQYRECCLVCVALNDGWVRPSRERVSSLPNISVASQRFKCGHCDVQMSGRVALQCNICQKMVCRVSCGWTKSLMNRGQLQLRNRECCVLCVADFGAWCSMQYCDTVNASRSSS